MILYHNVLSTDEWYIMSKSGEGIEFESDYGINWFYLHNLYCQEYFRETPHKISYYDIGEVLSKLRRRRQRPVVIWWKQSPLGSSSLPNIFTSKIHLDISTILRSISWSDKWYTTARCAWTGGNPQWHWESLYCRSSNERTSPTEFQQVKKSDMT